MIPGEREDDANDANDEAGESVSESASLTQHTLGGEAADDPTVAELREAAADGASVVAIHDVFWGDDRETFELTLTGLTLADFVRLNSALVSSRTGMVEDAVNAPSVMTSFYAEEAARYNAIAERVRANAPDATTDAMATLLETTGMGFPNVDEDGEPKNDYDMPKVDLGEEVDEP